LNDTERDQNLLQVFASAPDAQASTAFTTEVLDGTSRLRRRRLIRRALLGLLLSLLLPPLQDFGVALTQVLMISLVQLEAGLVGQLLAPINSVGAVLSAVLFSLRLVHKRLFLS